MTQTIQAPKGRIGWQDAARGIGIILVVLGHVEQGLVSSGILNRQAWHAFDFSLYTFHMPLFLFLAGLNVPRSLQGGGDRFVRLKLLSLMFPYVLWSVLQGLAMAGFSGVTNHRAGYGALLRIFWDPIPPFWFLYALFVFCVAARYLPMRILLTVSILLFPAGELFYQNTFAHRLLHFPLFFVAGMLFGSRWRVPRISWSACLAGLLVAACIVTAGLRAGMQNHDSVLMLPAAIGGTVVLLAVAQRLGGVAYFVWTGRISLAIYVMHILAAAGTRIVLQKYLDTPPVGTLYLVLCTAAGVGLPGWVYLIASRTGTLTWLGLQIGPRGRRWADTGTL